MHPTQVRNVSRVGFKPALTSIEISWRQPAAAVPTAYVIEYWPRVGLSAFDGGHAESAADRRVRNTSVAHPMDRVTLRHLEPGSEYSVRIMARFQERELEPSWSDITIHRTAKPGVITYAAIRVSERCPLPDQDCQPDGLTNHNAGTEDAVVAIMTIMALSRNNLFGSNWPSLSAITRYCVEQAEDQWGEYLSCNGRK